jgi:hypothetical protein
MKILSPRLQLEEDGRGTVCETGSTPDPTRGNRESQFRRFWGELTPQVEQSYLRGSALELFLLTIATHKIRPGTVCEIGYEAVGEPPRQNDATSHPP